MKEKEPKHRRSRLKRNGINPTRFDSSQLKFYAYLIPVGIIMALPIIFIFMNAFKPLDELFAYPPRFYVKRPTFDNFALLFQMSSNTNVPVSRYLFNSIVSTAVVVFATLGIAVAAGYVFSKKRFKLKNGLFNLNTLALMFVPTAVAIPRYFVIVYSHMLDSPLAHVLPLLAMPVGLFLIKQFVDQIPNALVEAAVIDGASDYTILVKIIVPMVAPALATVAMMAFQGAWNATEASTMFINNESLKNFAFYMSTLSNTGTNAVAGAGVAAAAGLIMFLPNLILFIILQSRVMNTMAHSGIK